MNKPTLLLKTCLALSAALLLVIAGSSCSALGLNLANPPASTPVSVTQVVTRVVTQDITRQVTRLVDIPVTVTPGPTLEFTPTPNPSLSGSSALPLASLPAYTDCLYGPASWYVYETSFPAGQQVEVAGAARMLPGSI